MDPNGPHELALTLVTAGGAVGQHDFPLRFKGTPGEWAGGAGMPKVWAGEGLP